MTAIPTVVEKEVTAENQFTDWLPLDAEELVAVSIIPGTATTIHVQRTFDGGITIRDMTNEIGTVTTYGGALETTYLVDARCELRLGCKTGNYGSGTTKLRLAKG